MSQIVLIVSHSDKDAVAGVKHTGKKDHNPERTIQAFTSPPMSPVRRHTEYLDPLYLRPLMRVVNSQRPPYWVSSPFIFPPVTRERGRQARGGDGPPPSLDINLFIAC